MEQFQSVILTNRDGGITDRYFPKDVKISQTVIQVRRKPFLRKRLNQGEELNKKLYEVFLDTDHEEIIRLVQKLTDEEIALWINKRCLNRSRGDLEKINQKILERKPDTQESLNRFNKLRNEINPTRTDITTWVELLELDENRISPQIP